MLNQLFELEQRVQNLEALISRLVCVGEVVGVDEALARVRVKLPGYDDVVTDWLPVLHHKTAQDKYYHLPDIGEMVICVFLPLDGLEKGFVVGAVPNEVDRPPVVSRDKMHIRFKDGAYMEYDRGSGTLTVDGVKQVIVKSAEKLQINVPDTAFEGKNMNITLELKNIKGEVYLDGNLTVTGNLAVMGNVSASGGVSAMGSVVGTGGVADSIGTLDTLRQDLNVFKQVYNQHTHVDSKGGPTSTPNPTV